MRDIPDQDTPEDLGRERGTLGGADLDDGEVPLIPWNDIMGDAFHGRESLSGERQG